MTRQVVIVCRGNICRSPMAEAVMRRELALAGKELAVASAGLAAVDGRSIDPVAERTLLAHGLSASAHRARRLDGNVLADARLVLAMERRQVAALLALWPGLRGRAHLLGRWRGNADIDDPYGRNEAVFEAVYARMETAVRDWCERL